MKKPLFWIAALLQAVYLLPSVAQAIVTLSSNYYLPLKTTMAISAAIHILVFYVFYLVFFPQFLYNRKIRAFIGWTLITIVVVGIGGGLIYKAIVPNHPGSDFNGQYYQSMVTNGLNSLMTGMIACVMRGFINWVAERSYRRQLEKRTRKPAWPC